MNLETGYSSILGLFFMESFVWYNLKQISMFLHMDGILLILSIEQNQVVSIYDI